MKATELKVILENLGCVLTPAIYEGITRNIQSFKVTGKNKKYVFSIGGSTPVLISWLDEEYAKNNYSSMDISNIQEFAYGETFVCNGVTYEIQSYGHYEPVDTKKVSAESSASSAGLFPAWEADGFED